MPTAMLRPVNSARHLVGAGLYKNTLRVVMDGRKSPLSMHRDYIEPITPDAE
jgi:hypothetical protein